MQSLARPSLHPSTFVFIPVYIELLCVCVRVKARGREGRRERGRGGREGRREGKREREVECEGENILPMRDAVPYLGRASGIVHFTECSG